MLRGSALDIAWWDRRLGKSWQTADYDMCDPRNVWTSIGQVTLLYACLLELALGLESGSTPSPGYPHAIPLHPRPSHKHRHRQAVSQSPDVVLTTNCSTDLDIEVMNHNRCAPHIYIPLCISCTTRFRQLGSTDRIAS